MDQTITDHTIILQKEKILSSNVFSRSPKQRQLLSYLLDKKLEGEQSQLKAYTIGVELFKRTVGGKQYLLAQIIGFYGCVEFA